jgi:hypothetical protein
VTGIHETHGLPLLRVMGALMGCTTCWRVVAFACGDVTFAGRNECRPNLEITALAEHYWTTRPSDVDSVEEIVASFRAALRGQGRDLAGGTGGRHAAGV